MKSRIFTNDFNSKKYEYFHWHDLQIHSKLNTQYNEVGFEDKRLFET